MSFQPTDPLRKRGGAAPREWRHTLALPLLLSLLGHAALMLPELRSGFRDGAYARAPALAWVPLQLVNQHEHAPQSAPLASDVAAPAGNTPHAENSVQTDSANGRLGGNGAPIYYKLSQLDSPALPVSAPDISRLRRLVFSGQAIRLRLWISAQGRVEHIDVLQADAADRDAVAEVQAMYYETAYMPPRRQGAAVAARMDIEMDFIPEVTAPRALPLPGTA